MDQRSHIVAFWQLLADHPDSFHYTEDQRRDDWIGHLAAIEHAIAIGDWKDVFIDTDCSGGCEFGYEACGCPPPSGPNYIARLGFTGTELANGRHVTQQEALPADFCVVGPGTGSHVVGLMQPGMANGGDPLVFSHGFEGPGGTKIRPLNFDTRMPRTFLRFDTDDHKAAPVPTPKPVPVAPIPPSADQYAARNGMVRIDLAEAKIAIHNGISYYTWHNNTAMFGSRNVDIPQGVVLFAFAKNLDAAKIPHAGA